jgi:phage/plasmid-associated DNA primase
VPPGIREATQKYRRQEGTVGEFLRECCVRSEAARVPARVLTDALRACCDDEGREPVSGLDFRASLLSRALERGERDKPGCGLASS